ncbi:hypothetical protein Bca52824_064919 [Brassica carinata]|uniref:Uncharacterized protein n=1 Tax=Brassica carinata TaxID=52824 RepID=A0A8X7QH98_BRACI|nr:hypothetical protein Bca52824_064919 [Brassica carinata]
MERKKRKGRTPEGVCNGRVSELISQTQISSAIDDENQSSKVSSKRGVRIGSEYVFYNPHIQKLARAHRRLRLSEKRGQLRIELLEHTGVKSFQPKGKIPFQRTIQLLQQRKIV